MLIYLGLSSHGFGHAARQAAVLSALHRLHPSWRLVISSALAPEVLKRLFHNLPIEIRALRWDVGMIQADALSCDPGGTLRALEALASWLPGQIEQECRWLREQSSSVVVLGDIPPPMAQLAACLSAPLVWMGNFGWDDIYAEQGPDFQPHVEQARKAYRSGTLLVRMPFDLAMDWGLPECRVGLTASPSRPVSDALHRTLVHPSSPQVLIGFGGLGLPLDRCLFDQWPRHRFLLPCPARRVDADALASIPNVLVLPPDVRPVDVMPYCDRLIGKPGFSTFCEALTAGLGLHVVERSGFAEAQALSRGLQAHGRHRLLTREAFDTGRWDLDLPLLGSTHPALPVNGADEAARAIASVAATVPGFSID